MTAERERLEEARTQQVPGKKWGPCHKGEDVKQYSFDLDSTPPRPSGRGAGHRER